MPGYGSFLFPCACICASCHRNYLFTLNSNKSLHYKSPQCKYDLYSASSFTSEESSLLRAPLVCIFQRLTCRMSSQRKRSNSLQLDDQHVCSWIPTCSPTPTSCSPCSFTSSGLNNDDDATTSHVWKRIKTQHKDNRMSSIDVRRASSTSSTMTPSYYPLETLHSISTPESAVVGNGIEGSENIQDSEWMDTLINHMLLDCPPHSDATSKVDSASQEGTVKSSFVTSQVTSTACDYGHQSQAATTTPAPSLIEWQGYDDSANGLPVQAEFPATHSYSGSLLKAAMNGGHVPYSSCVSLYSGDSLVDQDQRCRRTRTGDNEMPLLLRMITNVASNATHDGLLKLKGNVQPA